LPQPTQRTQPPLSFIPPALDLKVVWFLQQILPAIVRVRSPIVEIEAHNVETLVKLYQQFQAGQTRFMIAFRHPSADDPLCLAYLLSRLVPRTARQLGIQLKSPIHSHFLYDRGIPLWAGDFMGWLYSRLGGTPIHRGKIDLQGMRSARELFVNGTQPIAAAPEGATNGHTEVISPLEPGISQLAFWCVEDLHKAERSESVLLVPLGIQYRYITPPWKQLEQLLTQLEADAGLPPVSTLGAIDPDSLYPRLYRLGEHLLQVMEQYYTRFYHQALAIATPDPGSTDQPSELEDQFAQRLGALLDAALRVAEQYFNLQPKGSVIDRCRRLEQAGWDLIYREDIKQLDQLSPLERGLADRVAEEADLRIWHMRLVESFVAVTGKYVQQKPTVERFAETTLLMWDMLTRIKGNSPFNRPKLGQQRAVLTVGDPLSVSDRWDSYTGGRRNAKAAIAALTQELQTAMEQIAQR
jgi:1-acyl-sn-glycerol-3-phosphate acyltransferase